MSRTGGTLSFGETPPVTTSVHSSLSSLVSLTFLSFRRSFLLSFLLAHLSLFRLSHVSFLLQTACPPGILLHSVDRPLAVLRRNTPDFSIEQVEVLPFIQLRFNPRTGITWSGFGRWAWGRRRLRSRSTATTAVRSYILRVLRSCIPKRSDKPTSNGAQNVNNNTHAQATG